MEYLKSLGGCSPYLHDGVQGVELVFGGALLGYTISAWPKNFLDKMTLPEFRFVIFLLLFRQNYNSKAIPFWWIILDAVLITALMQMLDKIIAEHYGDEGSLVS